MCIGVYHTFTGCVCDVLGPWSKPHLLTRVHMSTSEPTLTLLIVLEKAQSPRAQPKSQLVRYMQNTSAPANSRCVNMKSHLFPSCVFLFLYLYGVHAETVLMTEIFALPIEPTMFNWTYEGVNDQFIYRPALMHKPDLPSWIHYKYSNRHHAGYLYGVPQRHNIMVELEIIALNRLNYETRRHSLPIHVADKLNPARHEVQLKIDNLNVEDMFDTLRMDRLKDVFRKKLWRDSEPDLYVTFLESAIELGGRRPLRPNEGEGVVIRLGSRYEFSTELTELQEEVKPLWKLHSCPRDFKRTTVERFFREAGFALDWCAFRLLENDGSAMHHSSTQIGPISYDGESGVDRWMSLPKDLAPQRSYFHELLFTIIVPMLVMIILVLILSLILCFHHEGITKRNQQTPPVQMAQYANIHRATNTLRSLSTTRDVQYNLAPDVSRSRTNSPNSSLARSYCRPSPPPYPAASKQDF